MFKESPSQKRQVEGGRKNFLMIGSHPRRYSSGSGGPQKVAVRREAREQRAERMFRVSGAVIISVMILSVLASAWYGWRVNKDLEELAFQRQELAGNTSLKKELAGQRDALLAEKTIVRKGAVLGLFPPAKKQLRIP